MSQPLEQCFMWNSEGEVWHMTQAAPRQGGRARTHELATQALPHEVRLHNVIARVLRYKRAAGQCLHGLIICSMLDQSRTRQ